MKAQLTLQREEYTSNSTIGTLFINGKFFCYTLEDFVRDTNRDGDLNDAGEVKVYGETAIPAGKYRVIVNMSSRFKRMMPLLLNVPGFDGIRMHGGNTKKDTLGCILVAQNKAKDFIQGSMEKELTAELLKYTEIEIEIIDKK